MINLERDAELEDELAAAFASWESKRPRNIQVTLGPSSLGACREFIRATIAGDEGIPERPRGLDGANVGTLLGEALEQIFSAEMGMASQVPITLVFEKLGLTVKGHSDLVYLQKNKLIDLKSKDGLASILAEGPSLENLIQISAYLVGAVQEGLMPEGSTAELVYYDRSGADKKFIAVPIDWESAQRFIELAEQRLNEVMDVYNAGSSEESRWGLRDKSPSICFATQCPFRINCWGGSEWIPSGVIDGEDELARVAAYVQMREDEKAVAKRRKETRENLRGIQGTTADGKWAVSWKPGRNDDRLDVVPL